MRGYVMAAILTVVATTAWGADRWKTLPEPAAMPRPSAGGMLALNGIEMYHARYGTAEGTPVLLIHGGLGHADLWAAQVADLAADRSVIVADTRGHGCSTNDGSPYSYALLARDCLALLDALGVGRVHVVGWSDGANIGFMLSMLAPERVASHFAHGGNVSLAGLVAAPESEPVYAAWIARMAADHARLSRSAAESRRLPPSDCTTAACRFRLSEMPESFGTLVLGVNEMWAAELPGGLDALAAIRVPTLVVQGEHEEAVAMEHARVIAATIPGARMLVLEDVGHFAPLQDPAGYTAAIRAFIGD